MEKQTLNQGLNKDLCIDIAEESDRILSTTTSLLNMLMQPKVQKLLTFISIYATVVTTIVIVVTSIYSAISAILNQTSPLILERVFSIAIGAVAIVAITAFIQYYVRRKFNSYSEEMVKEIKPFTEALKSAGHKYSETFKYYSQLIASCYQELCEGKSVDDIETLIICAKLDNLRRLDPHKISLPFED